MEIYVQLNTIKPHQNYTTSVIWTLNMMHLAFSSLEAALVRAKNFYIQIVGVEKLFVPRKLQLYHVYHDHNIFLAVLKMF